MPIRKKDSARSKATVLNMQRAVSMHHHTISLKFFNQYVTSSECDCLVISKNGHATEYEIKTSRADFKADFNKLEKHKLLREGGYITKHFYYLTPKGLLSLEDIPEYAGLVEYTYGHLWFKKKAPSIKVPKLSDIALKNLLINANYKYLKNLSMLSWG